MDRSFANVCLNGANEVFSCSPSRRSFISAAVSSISVLALWPQSSKAQTRTINLRNYGLKAINTTGSMTPGSYKLSLSGPAGFKVGDYVIVAVGGEAGAGQRGTIGVGGTWPSKTYGTVNQLKTDTSQPMGTYAWATATGDVYQWNGSENGGWARNADNIDWGGNYYLNKAIPKALAAKVTAIDSTGKVLTLNKTARVATSLTGVHFDNQNVFNSVLGDPSIISGDGVNVYVPPGQYAVGDQIQFLNKTTWTLYGDSAETTAVFSPSGVPSAMFLIEQCTNPVVQGLTLRGNALQNKFGLAWGPRNLQVGETYLEQGWMFPSGFLFHQCDGGIAQNLKITNVFQNAVAGSFTDGLQATNCACRMDDPLRQYVQWMFECADTTVGGTFTDCSVNSAYLVAGFEGFRSQNVKYIRPVGVNAVMSMNDVGNFLIQDANLTFTAMSQFDEDSFAAANPIVNINTNIGAENSPLGGTVSNMQILQQGYINGNNDILLGICINDLNAFVTVNGTSYTAPDYKSPSWGGPCGINSTGPATNLRNFTVVGSQARHPYGQPNVGLWGPDATISNCSAGIIRTWSSS